MRCAALCRAVLGCAAGCCVGCHPPCRRRGRSTLQPACPFLPALTHSVPPSLPPPRSRIPPERRHGSTFVFRCGSPLDPEALRLVSAATAGSIIISGARARSSSRPFHSRAQASSPARSSGSGLLSWPRLPCRRTCPRAGDYSRPPLESDTQVVRAAVLLDDLLARSQAPPEPAAPWAGGGTGSRSSSGSRAGQLSQPTLRPVVVAQVKGSEAAESLRYACGGRVHVVPTKQASDWTPGAAAQASASLWRCCNTPPASSPTAQPSTSFGRRP